MFESSWTVIMISTSVSRYYVVTMFSDLYSLNPKPYYFTYISKKSL